MIEIVNNAILNTLGVLIGLSIFGVILFVCAILVSSVFKIVEILRDRGNRGNRL
jgi:hypothetical protein